MPRLPDLEAWGVFARLSETQSFSRTAEDLGVATATVSKAITRLEARLGVSLLNRTSRRLALTDAGRVAAASATRILAEAETMEAGAMALLGAPAGLVRVAVPMSFGFLYVANMLPDFLSEYPDITVDLHLNDEMVDVIEGKFDLVLRIGASADAALTMERVCRIRRTMVATPAYLARYGAPVHPHDLANHRCLLYAPTPAPRRWVLTASDGEEVSIMPSGPLWASNGDALTPALLAGLGIAAQPEFLVSRYLAEGLLHRVMPGWSLPMTELHVITPPGKYRGSGVTTLIEFLLGRLLHEVWALYGEG